MSVEFSLVIAVYSSSGVVQCDDCRKPFNPETRHVLCNVYSRFPVCRECGLRREPSLVRLLDLGRAIEAYARAEREASATPPVQNPIPPLDSISSAVANAFSGRVVIGEEEMMTLTSLSLSTLYRLRQKGRLGYYQQGTRIMYGPQHVLDFLKSREVPARPPKTRTY